MKRAAPMRRTAMRRGRVRIGASARQRVKAGGVLANGRPAATLEEWRGVVAQVRDRAGDRCEVCGVHRGTDPHHVVPRSRGGRDHPDNVIWVCRAAHERVDWPYAKGRLVITPLGSGRFLVETVVKASKFA